MEGGKKKVRKNKEPESTRDDSQLDEAGTTAASADDAFNKLLQLVRMVQSGMKNIDSSHGLSGSQLWALWQISAHSGLRVTELAEAQHIHPSTASNLLDKLEARGLIRRERRDTDNRVVRIYLDKKGRELAKNIPGPVQGLLRNALREVPVPILDGLLTGVTSVLQIMDRASAQSGSSVPLQSSK